jgi:hypothetical protein
MVFKKRKRGMPSSEMDFLSNFQVKKGERRVPQATNRILGELFSQCGVEVYYSKECDNDDTLAEYAKHFGGMIDGIDFSWM